MFSQQAPDSGYASGVIAPRVAFTGRSSWLRPSADMFCAVVFISNLIASAVIMIMLSTGVNLRVDVSGSSAGVGLVPSDALQEELSACLANSRRLQAPLVGDSTAGIWLLMGQYPAVPSVLLLLVPVIAALWVLLMTKAARSVVWGITLLDIATYFVAGVFILRINAEAESVGGTAGDPTAAYVVIGAGVVLLIWTLYTRNHIQRAGDHLAMACDALSKPSNVQIFAAGAVSEALLLAYMAFTALSLVNAGFVMEVDPATCGLRLATWANNSLYYLTVSMFWVVGFLKMAQLQSTAMAIGAWYFEQTEPWAAFRGLRVAYTRSVGTLAIGSIITAIAESIVWYARERYWYANPWTCLLHMVLACFESLVMSVTRFCTVAHSLAGLPFGQSAGKTYDVLKRNFLGGYVTSRVGVTTLNAVAYIVALGIGFASWAWFDTSTGFNTLGLLGEAMAQQGTLGMILFLAFIGLYLQLVRVPMFTIFLVVFISTYLTSVVDNFSTSMTDEQKLDLIRTISTPMASLFIGSVTNVLLTFQARIILGAMETIFFCYAVGKDNGVQKVSGREDLYKIIEDLPEAIATDPNMVIQATPVANQEALATATAVDMEQGKQGY